MNKKGDDADDPLIEREAVEGEIRMFEEKEKQNYRKKLKSENTLDYYLTEKFSEKDTDWWKKVLWMNRIGLMIKSTTF